MAKAQLDSLWAFNRQRLMITLVGALIYAALWGLRQNLTLPNLLDIALRPDVVVPIFCGLIWGAVVGLGVGVIGSFLGDFVISGLPYPLYWDVGIGLLGVVAGLSVLAKLNWRTWKSILLAELWALLAIAVSLGFITLMQVAFEGLTNPWQAIFWPVFKSDAVNALILIPILLWAYQRFGRR